MSSDPVSTFEASLAGFAESCLRTSADEFEATISDLVEPPAVGVSLPFEDVSLSETGVETDPTPEEIRTAETGVTPAGLGIATYGTLTIRSRSDGDELVGLYPRRHVAVVAASDVVPDMSVAFDRLVEDFETGDNTQVLATGPSATADLGTFVRGVHGPERVDVVVLEDR